MFGGIGLPGAAVIVNNANLRGKVWESIVSLAGPLFTLIFTVALVALLHSFDALSHQWKIALSFLALLEILVFIFNLLPVPGLDGYGIIEPYLPHSIRLRMRNAQTYLFLILIVVLWTVPAANDLLWGVAIVAALAAGLQPDLMLAGQDSFRSGAMPLSVACILLAVIVQLVRNKGNKGKDTTPAE